jgi:citrate lyase subunit beta / citryl-CoA lyase
VKLEPRSWLYVPGHRPDRISKALASAADAVVIDLEDAVPGDKKDAARDEALRVLADRSPADLHGRPQMWVRINPALTTAGQDDMGALAGAPAHGLRVPRVEDVSDVRQVAERTGLPLQLLLETALGLTRAFALARAHQNVVGIGLGESDLAADLVVDQDEGLQWARGAVVVAARAAGLPSPVQSVWTNVADLDGLRASSVTGRAAGFYGRSVIHPQQIRIIHEVYTPAPDEVEAAREVMRAATGAASRGEVAVLDATGRFVDPAVVRRARIILDRVTAGSASAPIEGGIA